MAITKTTEVRSIQLFVHPDGQPGGSPDFPLSAKVVCMDEFASGGSPNSSDLPQYVNRTLHYTKGDDLSALPTWVQNVINEAWAQ